MVRVLKWSGITLFAVLILAIITLAVSLYATRPSPPPRNSESAARLADGPFEVGKADFDWVDTSRATPPNGDFKGADTRALPTVFWYPKDLNGAAPLIIYSHGFRSDREGGAYIAEHLASHGYVVASTRFPLSNGAAPGGPTIDDVPSQPGDVSFAVDKMLALSGEAKPFEASIDPNRIGAIGLSLGGLTTTLVTFHPEWRDDRIKVAISMAGPADVFGPGFFTTTNVPYLVISGTEDAIVPHRVNAAPMPDKIATGGLLEIEGGTHAGFANLMAGPLRLLGNPDALACSITEFGTDTHPFDGKFGGPELGLVSPDEYVPACSFELGETISAGRQHMIAKLAVRALLDTVFADTAADWQNSRTYLTQTLPEEFPEASYTAARN
ncbi:MAG: hypothetical protein CMK09_10365 [Ponticaulis sp.]|nr:hypothetical protein [Ponticaulis sp.]|tara:strand:- start:1097 stop:2245 length:1149 start_codon:yes stop_codon:yes gene_type:complete